MDVSREVEKIRFFRYINCFIKTLKEWTGSFMCFIEKKAIPYRKGLHKLINSSRYRLMNKEMKMVWHETIS